MKNFAIEKYTEMSRYDGEPYIFHLASVVQNVDFFVKKLFYIENPISLDQSAELLELLESAAWLHSILDNTDVTYEELAIKFGLDIANLVYACTPEKGRTYRERYSDKYFIELISQPYAYFIMACDFKANLDHAILDGVPKRRALFEKEKDRFISYGYLLDSYNISYIEKELNRQFFIDISSKKYD